MAKVVLIGSANGSANLGDESMWRVAAVATRCILPNCAITTDGHDGWVTPVPDVRIMPFLACQLRRSAATRGLLDPNGRGLVELVISRPARFRTAETRSRRYRERPPLPGDGLAGRWLQEIAGADALVFAGAGAICDKYYLNGIAAWSVMAAWARSAGVPIAFVGQGIGPLTKQRSVAGARDLLQADLVTVRDAQSQALAQQLGVANPILTADWAALDEPTDEERSEGAMHLERLGVSGPFLALSLHRAGHDSRDTRSRLSAAIEQVVGQCRELGLAVVFVPAMTSNRLRADDRSVLSQITRSWKSRAAEHVHLIDDVVPPPVARAILGRAAGLITTRYHPAIFALNEGVGVVGLSYSPYYDQKLQGALAHHGPASGQWYSLTKPLPDPAELIRVAVDAQPLPLAAEDAILDPYRRFLEGLPSRSATPVTPAQRRLV